MILFDMIGTVAKRRYQIAEQFLSTIGLNHTEAILVTLLRNAGSEATQEELSRMVIIDRSNVGRALRRLREHIYITFHKDNIDRIVNIIQLTPSGHTLARKIDKIKKRMANELCCGPTQDEAEHIIMLFNKSIIK